MNDDNVLVMNIGQYEVGASELGTLEFAAKPEQITLASLGDTVAVRLPGTISYVPRQDKPIVPYYPQVISLRGAMFLTRSGDSALGASLLDPKLTPFYPSNGKQSIALTFTCSRRYLEDLEDLQSPTPTDNRELGVYIEGVAAIVAPVSALQPAEAADRQANDQRLILGDHVRITVGQLARLGNTVGGDWFTVSQSRWSSQLRGIGYPQNRSIQIPTIDPAAALPELELAAKHLVTAQQRYVDRRYREAVQLCRQSRDALLGKDKPAWAAEHLTNALGERKTSMVNEAIKSLKNLGDDASHGDEKNVTVEVDRDTAEYVIGQLTLILHYINQKLR